MKTTIDLPPELVRKMKLRAVNEGRKLKDIAAELIRAGLRGIEKPNYREALVIRYRVRSVVVKWFSTLSRTRKSMSGEMFA